MNRENLNQMIQNLFEVNKINFDMRFFTEVKQLGGTACCVLGHMPKFGGEFEPARGEYWSGYSEHISGIHCEDDRWAWCFGEEWSDIDNTILGVQQRIQYLLDGGIIPGEPFTTEAIELYENIEVRRSVDL